MLLTQGSLLGSLPFCCGRSHQFLWFLPILPMPMTTSYYLFLSFLPLFCIALLPGHTMVPKLSVYTIELIISSIKFALVMFFYSDDSKALLLI